MHLLGFVRVAGLVVGAEQLVEQRAEVDERLAEVLGLRLVACGSNGDSVRSAIALDHHRVVD